MCKLASILRNDDLSIEKEVVYDNVPRAKCAHGILIIDFSFIGEGDNELDKVLLVFQLFNQEAVFDIVLVISLWIVFIEIVQASFVLDLRLLQFCFGNVV